MEFHVGDLVRLNKEGRDYYQRVDPRYYMIGRVVNHVPDGEYSAVEVAAERDTSGATHFMYGKYVEIVGPSDEEVAQAIESIVSTETWRTGT